MNKFDEMRQAITEARTTLRAADEVSGQIADLLVGRLRSTHNTWALKQLKRELRDFNIHTGEWKK